MRLNTPPSRAMSASMTGRSTTIVVGRKTPWKTDPRLEGQRRIRRRSDDLVLAVGEAQSMENQFHGLADAGPLEGETVELGANLIARHVDQPRDLGFQEIEIDRAGRQADRDNNDQRSQNQHDTGHSTDTDPIGSLDQNRLFPVLDDGDSPERACQRTRAI